MAFPVRDTLVPKKSDSNTPPKSPRKDLPPDLATLAEVFHVKISKSDPPDRIRHLCCKAVVKACVEGGETNWDKVERTKQFLPNLRNKKDERLVRILDQQSNVLLRLQKILNTVTPPPNPISTPRSSFEIYEQKANIEAFRQVFHKNETFNGRSESAEHKTVLFRQLFEEYLNALKTSHTTLVRSCQLVLGDQCSKDNFLLGIDQTITQRSFVKTLWETGEKHQDSVLKVFCIMLFMNFQENDYEIPVELKHVLNTIKFKGNEIRFCIKHGLGAIEIINIGIPIPHLIKICRIIGFQHVGLLAEHDSQFDSKVVGYFFGDLGAFSSLQLGRVATNHKYSAPFLWRGSIKHFECEIAEMPAIEDVMSCLYSYSKLTSLHIHIKEKSLCNLNAMNRLSLKLGSKNDRANITEFQLTLPILPDVHILNSIFEELKTQDFLSIVIFEVSNVNFAQSANCECNPLIDLFSKLHQLQTLHLSGFNLRGFFARFMRLPVSKLILNNCNIKNEDVKQLAENIRYIPNLIILHLNGNDIGDEGAQILLDALQALPRPITVRLNQNPISSELQKKFEAYNFNPPPQIVTEPQIKAEHFSPTVISKPLPEIVPPRVPSRDLKPPLSATTIQDINSVPPENTLTPPVQPSPVSIGQSIPKTVDVIQILKLAIENQDQSTVPENGDAFSVEATLLQGFKELRSEQALLSSEGSSQEQLRARALILNQDLKKEIAVQIQQLTDLDRQQGHIQEQLAEIKLKLGQKTDVADHQKLEREYKALDERAAMVKAQVDILMTERDIKEQKREAIKKFQSDPNLLLYYRTVQIKLEELFISFKAVAGGFVPVVSGDLAIYQTLLSVIGDHATIVPIIGDAAQKILNIASMIVGKVDNQRQNNTAMNASELVTLSEMKKFAESIARQLTENYTEQLQLLATPDQEKTFQSSLQQKGDRVKKVVIKSIPCPPAKQFAAFGVFWLINELCNVHQKDLKTEDLDRVLIAAVSQKSPPDKIRSFWQEITKKLNLDGIPDAKGVIRHPEEFYTLSGLKTDKGHYYSGPNQKPEIFGWRMGKEEDALKLGLKKVPTPTGRISKQEGGVKQVHLVEQKKQIDTLQGEMEVLKKGGQIIGGAKANEALEQNAKLEQQLNAQLKAEREKREKLEKEQKATADQLKATQEQVAMLAKAMAERKSQDPAS